MVKTLVKSKEKTVVIVVQKFCEIVPNVWLVPNSLKILAAKREKIILTIVG